MERIKKLFKRKHKSAFVAKHRAEDREVIEHLHLDNDVAEDIEFFENLKSSTDKGSGFSYE